MTEQPHPPTDKMIDSRYPYTYACDFIRTYGPVSKEGVVLSRSDASKIREAISNALGIPDEKLAIKLAAAQLANEEDSEHLERQMQRLMRALSTRDQ